MITNIEVYRTLFNETNISIVLKDDSRSILAITEDLLKTRETLKNLQKENFKAVNEVEEYLINQGISYDKAM